MMIIKTIVKGLASITIDVNGIVYAWTVGGLEDVADPAAHLSANADAYRSDIQTVLDMGRELEVIPETTLADLKAEACARIEARRLSLETAGVWIDWPDGTRSKIQTRNERDWRNINGVASRGLARLSQGQTDTDWFRDADNKNHANLLPTQTLNLGYQAAAAISAIAKVAQDAKDAIDAPDVATPEQVVAIEAAVAWPNV